MVGEQTAKHPLPRREELDLEREGGRLRDHVGQVPRTQLESVAPALLTEFSSGQRVDNLAHYVQEGQGRASRIEPRSEPRDPQLGSGFTVSPPGGLNPVGQRTPWELRRPDDLGYH